MIFIYSLYSEHGLLINLLVIISMMASGVVYLKIATSQVRSAQILRGVWLLLGLAIILVMTLSKFPTDTTGGFESLKLSQRLSVIMESPDMKQKLPNWHDPVGNILMTIPFATGLAMSWTARRTILTIALLSICVEIVQHFFIPGRTGQITDVVLNTLGGIAGVLLAKISYKIVNVFSMRYSKIGS